MSVTAVRPVLAQSSEPTPDPEPVSFDGSKWKLCACGCKSLLPIDSAWNYIKGHRTKLRIGTPGQVQMGAAIPGAVRAIEQEIALREAEIGKLREALKKLKEL